MPHSSEPGLSGAGEGAEAAEGDQAKTSAANGAAGFAFLAENFADLAQSLSI